MDRYAEVAVREKATCRFLFEGERLTEEETPKKVSLSDAPAVVCRMY